MTSTPLLNNTICAFVLPNQTHNSNDASASASSTMDDWMRNINDLQSLLMNKNEFLQCEIDRLTSQQQADKMKIDKAAAAAGRSSAQIMDMKNTTQSIKACLVITGEDVEILHSSIHTCKKGSGYLCQDEP